MRGIGSPEAKPSCRVTRWSLRPLRAIFSLLLFTLMCRLGEARVPGPDDAPWCLGIGNPSGLQGKYHVLSNVPADVMALSETHLSSSSKRGLACSLKSMRSKFKHILTGAPMAQRTRQQPAMPGNGPVAGIAIHSLLFHAGRCPHLGRQMSMKPAGCNLAPSSPRLLG